MLLDDFGGLAIFDKLTTRLGNLFHRCETRERAAGYVKALLSECQRKTSWQLAEWLGGCSPHGINIYLNVLSGMRMQRVMCYVIG
ncbi:hypothetical protein [Candidatus Regiella endosymbiont of Tuberolachnus salignus]|uniref:hypothetical protein n=1 Tax=Candidatus Regiella endosymbiont of Tuberolachnus salignus TaxID=3077956 RepID=UPI0030D50405